MMKPSAKHRKNRRGLTLLEMTIVCAVFSVCLLGIVNVVSLARQNQAEARALARLSLRANTEIESWKTKPRNAIKPGEFPILNPGDSHTTGTVHIRPFKDTPLMEITVTMQRKTHKGSRRVIFSTLASGEVNP